MGGLPCLSTYTCPLLLVGCLIVLSGINAQGPDPYVAEGKGKDVTLAAIDIVANIFGDDANVQLFMCRIAAVESRFGDDPNTYRAGYHGGIWQLDEVGFDATQDEASHPGLAAKFVKILNETGIDWRNVTWEDLRKPVYSAIAARLYLSNNPEPIPTGIDRQARYWKDHYNTAAGAGTVHDFRARVLALKGDPHIFQVVPGSDKPICYDVDGNDGDVLKFLDDPSIGLRIVAELFRRQQNQKVFVDSLEVVSGPNAISITPKHVSIGEEAFPWLPRQAGVGSGMDVIDVAIDKKTVVIETALAQIVVWKIFGHLDFDASPIGAFSRSATGILADVADNVQVVVRSPANNDIASNDIDTGKLKKAWYLEVSSPDGGQSTLKLRSNKRCWRFDRDETFERLIIRNLI